MEASRKLQLPEQSPQQCSARLPKRLCQFFRMGCRHGDVTVRVDDLPSKPGRSAVLLAMHQLPEVPAGKAIRVENFSLRLSKAASAQARWRAITLTRWRRIGCKPAGASPISCTKLYRSNAARKVVGLKERMRYRRRAERCAVDSPCRSAAAKPEHSIPVEFLHSSR